MQLKIWARKSFLLQRKEWTMSVINKKKEYTTMRRGIIKKGALMALFSGLCMKIFLIVIVLLICFADAYAFLQADLVSRTDTNYTISCVLPDAQKYEYACLFLMDPVTCGSFGFSPFYCFSNPVPGINYYTGELSRCSEICVTVGVEWINLSGQNWADSSAPIRIPKAADCLPPIANAGPDQTVAVGTTVTLDGAGSIDPDGNIVSYILLVIYGHRSLALQLP